MVTRPDVASYDLAVAAAAIKAARQSQIKRLFVQALIEDQPERREAILTRLADFIEQGRGRHD
jgi:hypothetical protein